MGSLLVVAACTSDASTESTLASTSPVITTVPPTTTTTTPDYARMFIDKVNDPDFSARFTVAGAATQPGGEISMTGAGAIVGSDSELWMVSDYSGLDGVFFAGGGARGFVGPGSTTATAQASKVVDGTLYGQDNGGYWHEEGVAAPNTTPGHVLAVLRETDSFEVAGAESVDGAERITLSPSTPLEYDPQYFSIDPSVVERFESDTTVVVDELGNPVEISFRIQAELQDAQDSTWSYSYELSDIGAELQVDPPAETWLPASSRGFTTLNGELELIDFEIPTTWETTVAEDGSMWAATPEGAFVAFLTVPVDEGADGEQLLREVAEAAEIDVDEVTESDIGLFPSWLATGTNEVGFGMVYSEVLFGRLLFSAFWAGPPGDTDLQIGDFREVLRTVQLKEGSGGGVVPGRSVGGSELQTDTLNLMTPVASVAAGVECESAEVIWTEFTRGMGPDWTEEWYIHACGDLQVHEIDFVASPDGGTDILTTNQPRRLGEPDLAAYANLDEDPHLPASLLATQPWVIDPDLGLDEIAVASAVTEARAQGSRLSVVILAQPLGDEFDGFADSILGQLGAGTVLLIDPESAGWVTLGDIYSTAELDQALDAALVATSDERLVERFVSSLHADGR